MKITFLIGNGFDINLGLKTKYSEFSKEDNENLKNRIIITTENIFKDIENIAEFE